MKSVVPYLNHESRYGSMKARALVTERLSLRLPTRADTKYGQSTNVYLIIYPLRHITVEVYIR